MKQTMKNISMHSKCLWILRYSGVFVCLFVVQLAWAGLGQSESSVEKDRIALGGKASSRKQLSKYSVHQLQQDSISIQEFVDANGQVFAITWRGSRNPDVNQLLGDYALEHEEALRQQQASKTRGNRRSSVVQSENIVVERAGFGRVFSGRAYIPAKIPSGVTVDEIK